MPDVILPALDEAAAITWVLERIPAGYRPIVVDNGSTDATAEIAAAAGATVVPEPVRGFGAACWAGLQAATADIVCFMDCDASLDPIALPHLVAFLERGDADLDHRRASRSQGLLAGARPTRESCVGVRGSQTHRGFARRPRPHARRRAVKACSNWACATAVRDGRSRWCCGRRRPVGESMACRSPITSAPAGRR